VKHFVFLLRKSELQMFENNVMRKIRDIKEGGIDDIT
jgi:hypothetical protein